MSSASAGGAGLEPTIESDLRAAWFAGDLRYLLSPLQVRVRDFLRGASGRIKTLRATRRWGKSRFFVVDANEQALARPGAVLRYCAPTGTDAEDIVMPHFDEIAADAPTALRPFWRGDKYTWYWPGGARCKLVGCDDRRKQNRQRGRGMHRGYVDEAGSIPGLRYLVTSVLLQQTMTTGGDIWIASSPSETPEHDSSTYFVEAEAEGRGVCMPIYDCLQPDSHLTPELVVEFMRETLGKANLSLEEAWAHVESRTSPDSAEWQREYLAEIVVDPTRAVVPEFAKHRSTVVVDELERPDHVDAYVSLDVGFHDLSVALFAHIDFRRSILCIEDEIVARRTRSTELDEQIAERERHLWGAQAPHRRIVDASLLVHAEIHRGRRVWSLAKNDEPAAAVNALRLLLPHRIRIHKRCKTLIAHLAGAIWNNRRTSFERVKGENEHHFDAVAALIYLVRHADWNHNPYPAPAQGLSREEHWIPPGALVRPDVQALRDLVRPRRAGRRY